MIDTCDTRNLGFEFITVNLDQLLVSQFTRLCNGDNLSIFCVLGEQAKVNSLKHQILDWPPKERG